jgi:nicotinate dehydrogenase subunit B
MKCPASYKQTPHDLFPEVERYELHAAPIYRFDLDRREFFKVLGCGVVVFFLVDVASAQESGRKGRSGGRPTDIGAWLHLGEDGTVTVFTGKVEVGQNIRTSLAQAVAEELNLPVTSVRMVMADTELTPYDGGTAGSRSTPDMGSQLHKVGAAAREALLDLAAEHFKTDRALLVIADGKVTRKSTKDSVTFAQLTKGQKLVRSVNDSSSTTPADKWKIAGTSALKANGRDMVTGKHKFTSDVKRPGMLHGRILRPAAFEATLDSADTKAAEAMSGVTVVRDGNFIGVTAPDSLMASEAVSAIKAEWTTKPQPSSSELFDYLKKNAGRSQGRTGGGGGGGNNAGSMEEGLKQADHRLERTYTIAYIAHTPLEPRAAVAEWVDGKLTVWTGTQRPFGVRSELAQAFSIPEERVRVIVPDTGSGYGGKHTGEAAIEAARLAKSAGKPVKLVWTRAEELTWAYFRPAGVIDVVSGVRNDGRITAWEFHNYNSGGSAIRTPYDIPNQKIEFHSTRSPLRQGSYRGLASAANVFAREAHMDELAALVKMDPLEFRLKNLKDARLRAVLEAAAKQFGWGKEKATAERGFGLACGIEKNSYVATCAEVLTDRKSGKVQVVRAVSAFECGAVVNPEHLKNQVEGCMVMGLGGALFEAIDFENGRIRNARLADYRVPRFSDSPRIEVVLVNRKDLPSVGAGETPIVGIAPAVCNAIGAATGIRLRSLPMVPDGLKG